MLAVIVGRRRQGKSTLAFRLATRSGKTIIVYDPNNQYEDLPVVELEQLEEWLETSPPGSICRIMPVDPTNDWKILADILDGGSWRWGDYALLLDECSMLMSNHKLDANLERYARTSPKDVEVYLTTHRVTDVNILFRSLATDWFFFNQYQELDMDVITKNQGADVAAATASLAEYHVVHWWIDKGGTPKFTVWRDPSEWFIQIGRRS